MSQARICVIVPARDESATIQDCLFTLRQALPQADVLVVDNASTDKTGALAHKAGANVLVELKPGKGHAVSAGIAWALQRGYEWLILHDADGEYEASDLVGLLAACRPLQPMGAVMGVGLRQVALSQVLWRSLLANWLARCALQMAVGGNVPADILTGARIFDASSARRLFGAPGEPAAQVLKGFELETALTRRALQTLTQIVTAPVRYTPRAAHQKKIRARDLLPILKAAWSA